MKINFSIGKWVGKWLDNTANGLIGNVTLVGQAGLSCICLGQALCSVIDGFYSSHPMQKTLHYSSAVCYGTATSCYIVGTVCARVCPPLTLAVSATGCGLRTGAQHFNTVLMIKGCDPS